MMSVVIIFIACDVHIVRLVEKIPDQYAIIIFKMRHDSIYIIVETVITIGIVEYVIAGALNPARVVNIMAWCRLLSKFGEWIPNGIKQNKHDFDPMLLGNA